jgi:predicted metal-dependent phosphoesterase TrpH
VHAAGGICVMAHPKYWRSSWRTEGVDFAAVERGLAALREKGLDGVEALYQANTPAENVEFIRLAKRQGYLLSAGSDFHGANKPQITLGMAVSQAYAAPLLERLGV